MTDGYYVCEYDNGVEARYKAEPMTSSKAPYIKELCDPTFPTKEQAEAFLSNFIPGNHGRDWNQCNGWELWE